MIEFTCNSCGHTIRMNSHMYSELSDAIGTCEFIVKSLATGKTTILTSQEVMNSIVMCCKSADYSMKQV